MFRVAQRSPSDTPFASRARPHGGAPPCGNLGYAGYTDSAPAGQITPRGVPTGGDAASPEPDSLFERFPWLYAFCREHVFRDDTDRIIAALWPEGRPPAGNRLLELGCGPGFYARRLAARFAHLDVIGIDRSERQVRHARAQAAAHGLDNCLFTVGDGRALAHPSATFDATISTRLFTILREPEQVLGEMHRVLRPGGLLFIAEPRSALRAAAPLGAMWLLAALTDVLSSGRHGPYREPGAVTVLTGEEFGALLTSQPWGRVRRWHDMWYQYALCAKDAQDTHTSIRILSAPPR